MLIDWPIVKAVVEIRAYKNEVVVDSLILEGIPEMAQQKEDVFKDLLGVNKGLARVSVSRSLSKKNYGNGGEMMISITTSCSQNRSYIRRAVKETGRLLDDLMDEQMPELIGMLHKHGITNEKGEFYS